MKNEMTVILKSHSVNEAFARSCVSAFCAVLNPSLDEINDIKTAVSEAVTNCVVHAYPNYTGNIKINVKIVENKVLITIKDYGIGISDINLALQPFWTSKPQDERSGMGFTVMQSFMDSMEVYNNKGRGITIKMTKEIQTQRLQAVGV